MHVLEHFSRTPNALFEKKNNLTPKRNRDPLENFEQKNVHLLSQTYPVSPSP